MLVIAMTDIESITSATGRGHLIPGPQSRDSAKLVTPSLQSLSDSWPPRARRDLCFALGSGSRLLPSAVSRVVGRIGSRLAAQRCTAISENADCDCRVDELLRAMADACVASRFARRTIVVVIVAVAAVAAAAATSALIAYRL